MLWMLSNGVQGEQIVSAFVKVWYFSPTKTPSQWEVFVWCALSSQSTTLETSFYTPLVCNLYNPFFHYCYSSLVSWQLWSSKIKTECFLCEKIMLLWFFLKNGNFGLGLSMWLKSWSHYFLLNWLTNQKMESFTFVLRNMTMNGTQTAKFYYVLHTPHTNLRDCWLEYLINWGYFSREEALHTVQCSVFFWAKTLIGSIKFFKTEAKYC